MSQVDDYAARAKTDGALRERLIEEYSAFVLSCASKVVGRGVNRSDDEWSVALTAFNEAIDSYDSEKGSFLSHARLVITRRIIDDMRASYRRKEVYVAPETFMENDAGEVEYEVAQYEDAVDPGLRDELLNANEVLKDYGFSFFDLAGKTPKKKRPREECAHAVNGLTDEPPLMAWMRQKRRLPLLRLCEVSGARKKTLSFFRFFIITGAEILTRDFPSLRRYFLFIRREAER